MKRGATDVLERENNKLVKIDHSSPSIPMNSLAIDTIFQIQDVLSEILKHLNLAELGRFFQVSNKANKASELISVWHNKLAQEEVPSHWQADEPSPKERLKSFIQECDKIVTGYPEKMISALGAKNIARLPMIKSEEIHGSRTGYLYFSGIGRGVSTCGRKYIGLVAKEEGDSQPLVHIALFERHKNVIYKDDNYMKIPSTSRSDYYVDVKSLEYLNRLVNKQHCGKVEMGTETEPKTTVDGKSMVGLIDAEEYKEIKKKFSS